MRTNASAACAARDSRRPARFAARHSRSVSASRRFTNETPTLGGSAPRKRIMPRSSFQCTNSRAPCCWVDSSSGSMPSSRRLRAASLTAREPDVRASSSSSASCSGTEAISRACAIDTSPAANASFVAGQVSTSFRVLSAARASPVVDPVDRAIQSDASANPRLRCSPHSGARSRTHPRCGKCLLRSCELLGDLGAVSPEKSPGSNETSASRNCEASWRTPSTGHLPSTTDRDSKGEPRTPGSRGVLRS